MSILFRVIIDKNNTNKIIYYGKIFSLMVIFWPFLPSGSFYNNWNSSLNWMIISLCICYINKSYSDDFLTFLKNKKEPR